MVTALDVSKYIITKCVKDSNPISNMTLQKILYYINRQYIQHYEELFPDIFEAWAFGPVIPSVYYQYCGFGSMPIDNFYNEEDCALPIDSTWIDAIVEQKQVFNDMPWVMTVDIQSPNSAWSRIYRNGIGNHCEIPNALIREEENT